jgi:hypothetical protein
MNTKLLSANFDLKAQAPRLTALALLAAFALFALFALTGCKNESSATADINPAGDYALVSVDGKTVPCSLSHEGVAMIVKSGTFTFNSDGTCRSLSTFSVPPHPDVHREVKATYTRQGAELTMRWQGAGMTKGRLNGHEFTMNNEGMIFSYRK